MKHVLISLLFFASFTLMAQSEKLTVFGIKGGYCKTTIDGHERDGGETGFIGNDFYVGLFADTKLSEKLRLENELLYSYTYHFNIIEIPVHIKYATWKDFDLLIGPKLEFMFTNWVNRDTYEFANPGFAIESGVQFHALKRFLAEFRYSYCLTAQLVSDKLLDINNGKRSTWRIGVGYIF